MLYVTTVVYGLIGALYVAVDWACSKGKSLASSIVCIVMTLAPIAYFLIPAGLPTPGDFALAHGMIEHPWDGWVLGLGAVVVAAAGFFLLLKSGLVDWLTRLITPASKRQ